jgi:hypothetical protein
LSSSYNNFVKSGHLLALLWRKQQCDNAQIASYPIIGVIRGEKSPQTNAQAPTRFFTRTLFRCLAIKILRLLRAGKALIIKKI